MKPSGAGSFYALGGHHGSAAGAASKASAKYQVKTDEYRRWRYCPNCGSKKVKTVGEAGFVPSGSIINVSQAAAKQPIVPPTFQAMPPPGWMRDPDDPSSLRWWDGSTWTEHRQDQSADHRGQPGTDRDQPADDREVVYGVSNWDESRRRKLISLLGTFRISFYFDREDVVVPKAAEQFVDSVIGLLDVANDLNGLGSAVDDTEIVYAIDPLVGDVTVATILEALDIPHSREPDGLVVDKHYEGVVDQIFMHLKGSPNGRCIG